MSTEERLATLETYVSHVRADVSDIKLDIRALDSKFERKFDSLNAKVENLKDSLSQTKIWALLMAGSILAVLARGFHWI